MVEEVEEEGWSWGCETYAREGERSLKARAWRRQVRTERRERRRERGPWRARRARTYCARDEVELLSARADDERRAQYTRGGR